VQNYTQTSGEIGVYGNERDKGERDRTAYIIVRSNRHGFAGKSQKWRCHCLVMIGQTLAFVDWSKLLVTSLNSLNALIFSTICDGQRSWR